MESDAVDRKEETKLLLRGCSCDNCKLSEMTNEMNEWCEYFIYRPERNVCAGYEKSSLLDFGTFANAFPSTIADDLLKSYPMKKATGDIFKLLSIFKDGT